MDELTLIRELRADPPPPSRELLASARAELISGRRRHHGRRWTVGAAALLSAAAVAGAVLVSVSSSRAPALADPASVLQLAAATERSEPTVVPRPDQYLYLDYSGHESWTSMDGTHDGLDLTPNQPPLPIPGCRGGTTHVRQQSGGFADEPCTPDPVYLADAPSSEPAMVAYLHQRFHVDGSDSADANALGKGIMGMFEQYYLLPPARAALFEAASALPGLKTVDLGDGRIGVCWAGPDGKGSDTMAFDAGTHAYLGVTTSAGDVSSGSVPVTAVVDRVGERP